MKRSRFGQLRQMESRQEEQTVGRKERLGGCGALPPVVPDTGSSVAISICPEESLNLHRAHASRLMLDLGP